MNASLKVLLTASAVLSAVSSSVMAMEGGAGDRDRERSSTTTHAAPALSGVECTDTWFSSGESIARAREVADAIAQDGGTPVLKRLQCCQWLADQTFVEGNLSKAAQMADLALSLGDTGKGFLTPPRRFAMNLYSGMHRYTSLLFVAPSLDKHSEAYRVVHVFRTILADEKSGLEPRFTALVRFAMAEMTAGIFTQHNERQYRDLSLQRDRDTLSIGRPTGEGLLACDIASDFNVTRMMDDGAAEALVAASKNPQFLPWIRQRALKALEQMKAEGRAVKVVGEKTEQKSR